MSKEVSCQDTKLLAVTLSLLVRRLAGMPPGEERDMLAAEMVKIKAELLAQQRERQLCVVMK